MQALSNSRPPLSNPPPSTLLLLLVCPSLLLFHFLALLISSLFSSVRYAQQCFSGVYGVIIILENSANGERMEESHTHTSTMRREDEPHRHARVVDSASCSRTPTYTHLRTNTHTHTYIQVVCTPVHTCTCLHTCHLPTHTYTHKAPRCIVYLSTKEHLAPPPRATAPWSRGRGLRTAR
jgi:hypothetical protein